MTLTIDPRDFCVPEGTRVDLKKWPTRVKRAYKSKKKYHKLLDEQVDELTSLQRLHYASNGYAVLVIFQGMDAAGNHILVFPEGTRRLRLGRGHVLLFLLFLLLFLLLFFLFFFLIPSYHCIIYILL